MIDWNAYYVNDVVRLEPGPISFGVHEILFPFCPEKYVKNNNCNISRSIAKLFLSAIVWTDEFFEAQREIAGKHN